MKVFISHAVRDAPFARAVASHLRDAGFQVWEPAVGRSRPPRLDIVPRDNVLQQVGEALQNSDAMVTILSGRASSRWVQQEIAYALGERRFKGRLIPVVVGRTAKIPWVLQKLNTVRPVRARDAGVAAARVAEVLKGNRRTAA